MLERGKLDGNFGLAERLTAAGGGALALLEGEDVLCRDWAGRDKADKGDWEEGCELHLGMDAAGTGKSR